MMSDAMNLRYIFHVPAAVAAAYLVEDTADGREIIRRTPEGGRWVRVQALLRALAQKQVRVTVVVAVVLVVLGMVGLVDPLWVSAALLIWTLTTLAALHLSEWGHQTQRAILVAFPGAHPTPYRTRAAIDALPESMRGVPTMDVFSRAAATGDLPVVYAEISSPGGPHSPEIEAVMARLAASSPRL